MEWADETGNADAVLDLFRGTQSCWLSGGILGRVGASWRDRIPLPPKDEPIDRAGWLSASAVIDFNLGELARAVAQALDAATIVDALIKTDPGGDWIDSVVAIYYRGILSCTTGNVPAALVDADRLNELPRDPTGYGRYFSAHIRALALLPEWTAESMAATNDMVEASRSVSQLAYAMASSMLGNQMFQPGSYEESIAAALFCLESPVMLESVKIMQLPNVTRPLTALGRYEEALDIIKTDFGPMLEAQHRNLRLHQLLSLAAMLHDLDQLGRRDHLASIVLALDPQADLVQKVAMSLVEILGSDDAVAALPVSGSNELTASRVTALIADVITEFHDHIASPLPGPLTETAR